MLRAALPGEWNPADMGAVTIDAEPDPCSTGSGSIQIDWPHGRSIRGGSTAGDFVPRQAQRKALEPERSWACGPPRGMKIGLRKAWSAITSNFVISTGAKRSGEICGFPYLAQRARQIWGTPGGFAGHISSRSRVPHPCENVLTGKLTQPTPMRSRFLEQLSGQE